MDGIFSSVLGNLLRAAVSPRQDRLQDGVPSSPSAPAICHANQSTSTSHTLSPQRTTAAGGELKEAIPRPMAGADLPEPRCGVFNWAGLEMRRRRLRLGAPSLPPLPAQGGKIFLGSVSTLAWARRRISKWGITSVARRGCQRNLLMTLPDQRQSGTSDCSATDLHGVAAGVR